MLEFILCDTELSIYLFVFFVDLKLEIADAISKFKSTKNIYIKKKIVIFQIELFE